MEPMLHVNDDGWRLSLVTCWAVVFQEEERDPDVAFREIAKFGILHIAGMLYVWIDGTAVDV